MSTKTSNNYARPVDLESLAEIHPDECSSSNFLDPEIERQFQTVGDFLKAYEGTEVWLNLCVRWDIERDDDGGAYHARVAILLQRKGVFVPVRIARVEQTDLSQLLAFFRRHWEYLRDIWRPISEPTLDEFDEATR